jgi:hypothetical protein
MPSTLKHIDKSAFSGANVKEIRFGSCKLETIERMAFTGCGARTVIPDTVRKIGAFSLGNLEIGSNKTIRLPSALRFLGYSALNIGAIDHLVVDERLVTDETNLEISILSSLQNDQLIMIHVFRGEEEIYSFIMCRGRDIDKNRERRFWARPIIGSHGLDFWEYDYSFDKLESIMFKVVMAANRVVWPIELRDSDKERYTSYAKDHYQELMGGKEENIEAIRAYGELDLISLYHLKALFRLAQEKKNVELTAYLLDLINRKFGSKGKSLKL